jgi:uncharacterized protein (DUF1501 family)
VAENGGAKIRRGNAGLFHVTSLGVGAADHLTVGKTATSHLPRVDQAVHALVTDLEACGLLDDTLVLALGEFGRSPVFSQRGTGGREHWPNCMSMLVAGGGLAHGQVVGSTDAKGYDVKDARVTPADLGATVFRHLGIDLAAQWTDLQGRPHPIVPGNGRPIPELT